MTEPSLTVVVPSVNGVGDLMGCLAALSRQRTDVDLEVLVADRCGEPLRDEVRRDYPWVRLLEAPPATTIPDLRALAFREARGRSVAVIEDHVIVPPGWARALLDAQAGTDVVVGGAIENAAVDRLVDWAAFLCEYSHCITPLPEGPADWLPGNNVVYPRALLGRYESVLGRGQWENRLHDAMRRDGVSLVCRPQIAVGHKKHYTIGGYLSQRYLYARSYAGLELPARRFRSGSDMARPLSRYRRSCSSELCRESWRSAATGPSSCGHCRCSRSSWSRGHSARWWATSPVPAIRWQRCARDVRRVDLARAGRERGCNGGQYLMRIGVDATCWANARGYGRFARELLRAMVVEGASHEFVCFVDERSARCFDLAGAGVRAVLVPQSASPTTAASANGSRSLSDMWRMTRAVAREELDVFFSPSVYTYFPLPPTLAAVVTFHDAIADRFPELTLPSSRARLFWRMKVQMALAQSRIVLTVSDYAATQVSRTLGVRRDRIRIAVEAAAAAYKPSESPEDVVAAARRAGIPDGRRWFAYVGGFNPHKHVDAIVRAHATLVGGLADPPILLLVGEIDADPFYGAQQRIRDEIARSGTGDQVRWAGYVPDDELRHLLSGALALVLPSESEGFGLPAVEAAACGVPVIATTESPLPQLLAGGGIFTAPRDELALGAAMRRLATDEPHRRALAAGALARAGSLSWTSSARAALNALAEAAA